MTRPGSRTGICSAMAFQALAAVLSPCRRPPGSHGLAAGISPEPGNSVKMTPSTPLPGSSMVWRARERAVYWAGWCSALGVVGPYWSQLH